MLVEGFNGSSGGGGTDKPLLLNNDYFVSETGDWSISAGDKNAGGIRIINVGVTGHSTCTLQKVDLRGYDKLYVAISSDEGLVYWGPEVGVFDNPIGSYPGSLGGLSGCIAYKGVTAVTCTVVLDISAINEGYIAIGSGRAPNNISSYISHVYLSND